MIDIILTTLGHPTFSIVTFLAGLILGHRFSLFRDRRKEFNAVATPINIALLKQLAVLKTDVRAPADPYLFISFDDFNTLEIHLPRRIVPRYKKDLEQYKKAADGCGLLGSSVVFHIEGERGVVVEGLAEYIKATEKMLAYVQRK